MKILHTWDVALLKAINGWHSPFTDVLMWWTSDRFVWIPLYLLLLWLLYRSYGWKAMIVLIPCAALIILAADQASWHVKEYIMRLRPSHNESFATWLHMVNNYRGGTFGFYSAHAANSMALALWCGMLLHRKYKKLWIGLLFWSLLIGYSRIYLGVHYPSDVAAGFVSGTILALVFVACAKWCLHRLETK